MMKPEKIRLFCTIFSMILVLTCCTFIIAQTAGAEEDGSAPSVWDGVVPAPDPGTAFSGGAGTEADPYLIGSAQDLIQLAVNVCNHTTYQGVYFRMTVDVDCGNKDGWLPIGGNTVGNNSDANYVDASFCGVFDGGGHTVSNWKINEPLWHSGFFGQTIGATIRNLGIESGSIVSKKSWVGGIVGLAVDTTVQNCYSKAEVKIERTGGTATAGGLIGKAQGNIKMENCYFAGSVTVLTGSSAGGNVGGLIGVYGGGPSSEVKNCWNTGNVLGKNAHAGGLFGTVTGSSTAVSCFSLGNVALDADTASAYIGSAVGQISSASGMILTSGVLKASTPTDQTVGFFVSGYYQPDCQITLHEALTLPLDENSAFMGLPDDDPEVTDGGSTGDGEEPSGEQPEDTAEEMTTAKNEDDTGTPTGAAEDTAGGDGTVPASPDSGAGCSSALLSGTVIWMIGLAALLCGLWLGRRGKRNPS